MDEAVDGAISPALVFVSVLVAVVFIFSFLIMAYVNNDNKRGSITSMWFVYLLLAWLGLVVVVAGRAFFDRTKVNVKALVVCAVGVIVMGIFASMVDKIDDMVTGVTLGTLILGLAYFAVLIHSAGDVIGLGYLQRRGQSIANRLQSRARKLARR